MTVRASSAHGTGKKKKNRLNSGPVGGTLEDFFSFTQMLKFYQEGCNAPEITLVAQLPTGTSGGDAH